MGIESKRLEWIDLMRVIAIILVVLCHSVEGGVYFFHLDALAEVSTASRVFAFNIFTFSRLASCLFLMISGYLLLDRVYDKEKIFRFLIP